MTEVVLLGGQPMASRVSKRALEAPARAEIAKDSEPNILTPVLPSQQAVTILHGFIVWTAWLILNAYAPGYWVSSRLLVVTSEL